MSDVDEYIKREQERINKRPAMIIDTQNKVVTVENSKENLSKFSKYVYNNVPKDFIVVYKPREEYQQYSKVIKRQIEIEREQKRQEEINNPQIDKEILNIKTHDDLINFLMQEYLANQKELEWEYSTDFDVSTAEINANYSKLKELVSKFKEGK